MKHSSISVVIPAYGDISRLMDSIYRQYRPEDEDWKIEVIIANDNLEDPSYEHIYDRYYDSKPDYISLVILNHKDEGHWYQGRGRMRGVEKASSEYVLLMDCDDEYAPYAFTNFFNVLNSYEGDKKLAYVSFDFLSYDKGGYFNHIGRDQPTIWVQSRLYSREFIMSHSLHKLYDETAISSKRAEDYPFINILDYMFDHEKDKWESAMMSHETPPMAYWTPNKSSFSRKDPYYGQNLASYTMNSSLVIYEQFQKYNQEHSIPSENDEYMKMRLLNMVIYSYFNLYDFIWTVGQTKNEENPYKPDEKHWTLLRDSVAKLRATLKDTYYDEIQVNDVFSEYEAVLHRSDARIHNVFEDNFFTFMDKGSRWLAYDHTKMMEEATKLDFDAVNCLQSKQVKAWQKRNNKQLLS